MAWEALQLEIAVEFAQLTGPSGEEVLEAQGEYLRERVWEGYAPPKTCQAPGCSEPRQRVQGARTCERHGAEAARQRADRTNVRCKENRAKGLCGCGRPPSPGFRTCERCRTYQRERYRSVRSKNARSARREA